MIQGAKKILGLPPANKLIPKNFGIKAANPKLSAKPSLIKQWADTDLWYMKDDKFERPKCKVSMKLYTNDCGLGFNAESREYNDRFYTDLQAWKVFTIKGDVAESVPVGADDGFSKASDLPF